MPLHLYNTLTHQLERFRRRTGEPVTVYVCGITPYDTTHLGHAFTYVTFDVLIRHLETVHQWPVRYVQNLTDIDDDVLKRATQTGEDWRSLGLQWTSRFTDDLTALNLRPPDRYVGATAQIAPIRANIEALLAAELAYVRNGSVYFRVAADPGFGALAALAHDEMLTVANERGNFPDDPNKADPLDFVLWQAGKPGEPAWHSPWGEGRPGWHIECSTIARALLGDQVDIHGGGADLVFPHHACEIAQCEPLTGVRPWVRFWMHVAMVRMDGEKMSKSLGNLVLIDDLLKAHPPDMVRIYLLSHHYRESWEWDPDTFAATAALTQTLHAAIARTSDKHDGRSLDPATYGPRFTSALDDDLDTRAALSIVLNLADDILAAPMGTDVRAAQDVLRVLAGQVLGLWLRPMDQIPAAEPLKWPAPEIGAPDVERLGAGD